VLIPVSNTRDLQLDSDVIAAVAAGRFHVWEVATVEEGIELLTGVPAGQWDDTTGWTEDSVYARCQRRLDEMVELMRVAAKGPDKARGPTGLNVREGDDASRRPEGAEELESGEWSPRRRS
jgi:hypothetical protein